MVMGRTAALSPAHTRPGRPGGSSSGSGRPSQPSRKKGNARTQSTADERVTGADCGEPHRLDSHASLSLVTNVVTALCTVESGLTHDSTGLKRRPEPHGHGSLRPSFSTSSLSTPTTRSPRLTRDSLERTPGGVCASVQKDAWVSSSRYMTVLLGSAESSTIVASAPWQARAIS
jgi:hypothetical protein